MFPHHRPRALVLLTALLVAATALAGCMEGSGGSGDGPEEMTEEEARAVFQTAMRALKTPEGADAPERFSMHVTAEARGMPRAVGMEMEALVDARQDIAIMHVGGDGLGGGGGMPLTFDAMLMGQVGKTGFFGTPSQVLMVYNESAEPVEGWDAFNMSDESGGEGMAMDPTEGMPFADPQTLLNLTGDLEDEGVEVTHEAITHEGAPALRVRATQTNGTGSVEFTAIVWTEPPRPALIVANVTDSEASDPLSRNATIRMAFGYDDTAGHTFLDALLRLESMTFLTDEAAGASFGGASDLNWTIQPSINPGLVPLDEVEARVMNGSDSEPALTLRLEEGSAENDRVRITFTDADGDGHVSPGDAFAITPLTDDDADYRLALYDEETAMVNAAPGPGALAALLALAGAVVLARRR